MSSPEPVEVAVGEGGSMHIRWSDEHQSVYPRRYLRGYCPCAHCQGHGGRHEFVPNDAPRITAVEEVGRYALNIRYAGGHDTGIYTFELLRRLCPCDACTSAAGPKHPYNRLPADERARTAPVGGGASQRT